MNPSRRPLRIGSAAFLASLLLGGAWAGAPPVLNGQETGTLAGYVVDAGSLEPVPDLLVSIEGTALSALTRSDGRFVIPRVPAGEHVLRLQHLSYGEHTRSFSVEPGEERSVQVRISRRAVELSPLVVEALGELERRRLTSGHAMNEVGREAIDDAARRGLDLSDLLRQELPGVRVRSGGRAGSTCVEYRGASSSGTYCREMNVYIDGVQASQPSALYSTLPLEEIERLEVLSPGEAGLRHGSRGGWGALLIETRQGPDPRTVRRSGARSVRFDWSREEKPFPWAPVLGSSFLANAAGLGVGVILADRCLRVRDDGILGLKSSCGPLTTAGVSITSMLLPSVSGALAARRAGATERSRGRLLSSAVLGTISLGSGYVLWLRGETGGSDIARAAGGALLTLGAPLLAAVSERLFRVAR